jgi:hypothetical protein
MFLKVLSLVIVAAVSGCASVPQVASLADTMAKYEALKKPVPERVIFDFEALCNDDGMCYVSEHKLDEAETIITLQNDVSQGSVIGTNALLDSLASMEHRANTLESTLYQTEKARDRDGLVSGIKQALTTGALIFCAVQ